MQQNKQISVVKQIAYQMASFVFALLSTIGILGVSEYSITHIDIVSGLLFLLVLLDVFYFRKHIDKTKYRSSFLAAVILTVSSIAGLVIRGMDEAGLGRVIGLMDIVYGIGICGFAFITVHNVYVFLQQMCIKGKKTYQITRKHWLILTVIMVIMWLPYYSTFFPGIFGSDPIESIRQAEGMIGWTNHHPILYTAFIKLFLLLFQNLVGINAALGIMILAQQLIFAGVLAYVLCFFMKRSVHPTFVVFSILFVTVNPVIAIFSVYATKDVLYSACVLLFIVKIFEIVEQEKETLGIHYWIGFGVIALLVIFLRNNGSFIVLGSLLVLLCMYRKKWKIYGSLLLILLLSLIIQKQVVFPLLDVEEGSFAESLSIPLQQIGQAVVDGAAMTEEEEAFLRQLMPLEDMADAYEAGYTDPIKFHDNFDDTFLNDNKMTFIKTWFGMLPENFDSYVKAYLLQTAGYWDVSQTDSIIIYGVVENEFEIRQVDGLASLTGYSLQPVIEKLILVCRKAPVLCYLTNMAMMLFFSMFASSILGMKGNRKLTVCLVPLWITWGTIMIAAPASCKFRYLLPFYLAWPFMIWLFLEYGMKHEEQE